MDDKIVGSALSLIRHFSIGFLAPGQYIRILAAPSIPNCYVCDPQSSE